IGGRTRPNSATPPANPRAKNVQSLLRDHSSSKRVNLVCDKPHFKGNPSMRRYSCWLLCSAVVASLVLAGFTPQADSMCGYFRPVIVDVKNPSEMLQPSQ